MMPLAMNQSPNDHIIDLLLYITTKHSIWMGRVCVLCAHRCARVSTAANVCLHGSGPSGGLHQEKVVSYSWDKGPSLTLWIITATRGHSEPQRERDRAQDREDKASSLFHSIHFSPSRPCHNYQFKWSIMQNGDNFGFRGCDRENCRLMWGKKEKKDGDFVGQGQCDMRLWGLVGAGWGLSEEKWGLRGLIKVTSECFILSKTASQTGNTLRGFAERGGETIGGGGSSLHCLSQYKPEATHDSGVQPPLITAHLRAHTIKGHSARCNIARREFPEKLDLRCKRN